MRGLRAFTLIEIIIVLSILAILGALAVPLAQTMQNQARNSAVRKGVGVVRSAVSIYRSSEVVAGRFPGYPTYGQLCDILDFCTAPTAPKVMDNGDLPPNPWARLWNNDPNVDPDSIGNFAGATNHPVDQNWTRAWLYDPNDGEFWANSAGNGGDPDCASGAPWCRKATCDMTNPTENCY